MYDVEGIHRLASVFIRNQAKASQNTPQLLEYFNYL